MNIGLLIYLCTLKEKQNIQMSEILGKMQYISYLKELSILLRWWPLRRKKPSSAWLYGKQNVDTVLIQTLSFGSYCLELTSFFTRATRKCVSRSENDTRNDFSLTRDQKAWTIIDEVIFFNFFFQFCVFNGHRYWFSLKLFLILFERNWLI